MNVGTLIIEIVANVARLIADMQASKKAVADAMGDITKSVEYAKTAFIALGGVTSVAGLQSFVSGGIEAKARLYDLSIQTGITVEALSGLGKIAKYSNTELTDIAGASNKLSKALFTQNEDSKGAAQAIKALGLNFNEFKQLQAQEQFVVVAEAMGKFQDGTEKSAAAMLLYGKTGATLLPFLKELEERGYAVGKQTTESALLAKKYEDNLVTLKIAADAWKRTLADSVLPTMINVTDEFIAMRQGADQFNVAGEAIKITMQTVAVLGANVSFVLQGIGREIGAVAAQAKLMDDAATKGRTWFDPFGTRAAVKAMDSNGYTAISDAVKTDGERALSELKDYEDKILGLKPRIASFADFQRSDKDTSAVKRPRLGLDPADAKTAAAVADGYDALIAKIRAKVELDQLELDTGRQVTESEKFRLDVYKDVEKNFEQLSVDRLLAIDQETELAVAVMKQHEAWKESVNWIKEATDANATYVEGQMQLRDQMQQQVKDAQLQLSQYGLTAEQLHALESARLLDAAAALQRRAALADDVDLSGKLSALYRDQAQALRDNAAARDTLAAKEAQDRNDPTTGAARAVKDYLAEVKRAGDATYGAVSNSIKGLEDLTVTALSGGDARNAAKAWVTGIITEIERLYIVKPLMAQIFGGSAGGSGGGWLGALGSIASAYFGGGSTELTTSQYSTSGFASGINSNYGNEGINFGGPRAGGGPVSAGTDYLVGEKGPEILRMGSQAGSIAPNAGSRDVKVQVINNGQPVQARQSQQDTSQGTIVTLVLDAVANDIASGGKTHDAVQQRFGLNPGGSTPRH